MIGKNKIGVWTIAFILWTTTAAFCTPDSINEIQYRPLFKIVRSNDKNEIWYVANQNQDGVLNFKSPLKAFWIKKAENNRIEALTWVQNRYSYGIQILETENLGDGEWEFRFVSYPKVFKLKKATNNDYRVFTNSENKEMEVKQIYVHFEGGTQWIPKVSSIKISGIEIKTGNEISETIIP